MKTRLSHLTFAIYASSALITGSAFAQLAANQTHGFGNGRLVTFTYLQNFDCVDQPTLDLDFNKIPAQSDPNEMQTPICQPDYRAHGRSHRRRYQAHSAPLCADPYVFSR